MICPQCNSPLEPSARFCGVCGYRLAPTRPPGAARAGESTPPAARLARAPSVGAAGASAASAASSGPALAKTIAAGDPAAKPLHSPALAKQAARAVTKPRIKSGDEIYIDQVLNNRFKVESKIGEGGFGAVYRGVQLATGRKVALKLLHPEMTKDENLVARFRREGMVLCNLRDAHTITTYDFDQTPDGTLYIAMELLEGKSLHQIFHEEAPLDWKRVFKILTEMCSSLAEAHAQGIVHRDLKPENIYLESRPGNPEFVKILDFGIAKVMRGDTIDPQSPQLTATGQTLGTLEYMSPEQLMGKPLDGRSDVYALGVLAYEMITGRLPFPDAKGPAGLITAQLKQTPVPPSQAHPRAKATLSKAADRAILKCLEKDKNNRFPDVSALAVALQEAMSAPNSDDMDLLETRRSDAPSIPPTPAPAGQGYAGLQRAAAPPDRAPQMTAHAAAPASLPPSLLHKPQAIAPPLASQMFTSRPPTAQPSPYVQVPSPESVNALRHGGGSMQLPLSVGTYPPQAQHAPLRGARSRSSKKLVWWVIVLLAVGAGVGTALALLLSK